jgi:hypothetical protein
MSPTPRGKPPSDAAGEPAERPGRRGDARLPGRAGEILVPRPRARAEPSGSWSDWVRAQPVLAGALLAFCLFAIGGLMLVVPSGIVPGDPSHPVEPGSAPPAAEPEDTAPPSRGAPAVQPAERETPARVPWTVQPASAPSPRGLALVYAYRALPPGGESRFEWFVRLQGVQSLLDRVDVVRWRMDPPPKDGNDLVSRNRAGDGFPLMGDGPGGWFGVSATVRYKDGKEETLSRRIELPE